MFGGLDQLGDFISCCKLPLSLYLFICNTNRLYSSSYHLDLAVVVAVDFVYLGIVRLALQYLFLSSDFLV